MLSKIRKKNKKAISLIVAYVLLITIAISLSVLVYGWLRFRVIPPSEKLECPKGVSVIIKDYDLKGRELNLTLQNKGRFSVDGFVVRANDRPGSRIGVYILNRTGVELKPEEEINKIYTIDKDLDGKRITETLTYIEIQPFIKEGDEVKLCEEAIASQVL